jgi:hypothetical protein
MGGSPKAPEPSAEEKSLQAAQTDLLRQQRDILAEQTKQQNMLSPLLYEEMGIIPTKNDKGEITGYTLKDDPVKAINKEVELGFAQRSLKALKGELPIDPTLERQLTEGKDTLNETLRSQLGSDYATSTPGIQALAENDKRAIEIRDAARRGDLTLNEQLGLARQGGNQAATSFQVGGGTELSGLPLRSIAAGNGIVQGGNQLLNHYAGIRQQQLQASVAGSQQRNQMFGGIASSAIAAGGMAAVFI